MNIDDILKLPGFAGLNSYLDEEMYKCAGAELYSKMNESLGNHEHARNWFYSQSTGLGDKRPYDLCKENQQQVVLDELGKIDSGYFS